MGCNILFFNKIPRTRLYLTFPLLAKAFLKSISGNLNSGKCVLEFEKEFASFLKISYAHATPYARIALNYILKAFDLPLGSEVLMTSITIPEIVNVIDCLGLKPVFVDIEAETCNIDRQDLAKKVNSKSKVLLLTHLFGFTPDMEKIIQEAEKHNLIVIEDISQSFGCKYKGKYLGSFGRAGFCSLSWIKTLTTLYGGMIITEDKKLLYKIKEFSQGLPSPKRLFFVNIILKSLILKIMTQKIIFSIFTFYILKLAKKNYPGWILKVMGGSKKSLLLGSLPSEWFYKFGDLQAEIGKGILKNIKINDEKRRKNVEKLLANLSSVSRGHLPGETEYTYNTYWRLPFIAKNIGAFQKYLFDKGVDNCGTTLAVCSREKAFLHFESAAPHAEYLKDNMTYVPVHPSLGSKDMVYIANLINSYFEEKRNERFF